MRKLPMPRNNSESNPLNPIDDAPESDAAEFPETVEAQIEWLREFTQRQAAEILALNQAMEALARQIAEQVIPTPESIAETAATVLEPELTAIREMVAGLKQSPDSEPSIP